MTKRELLRDLEEQLELPAGSLKEDQVLAGLRGWDSMASVQFIALVDEKLQADITGDQIAAAKTVGGLIGLVEDRLSA